MVLQEKLLYSQKCSSCHAIDGAGLKNLSGGYIFPTLWGDQSFSDATGMARDKKSVTINQSDDSNTAGVLPKSFDDLTLLTPEYDL